MTTRIELGRKIAPGAINEALRLEFTYSVIDLPPVKTAAGEKRRKERLRTRLRAGQLSDKRHKTIVDCLIQDRSDGGARLLLSGECKLPAQFVLFDEVTRDQMWVELAWQRGKEAGVKLVPA